MSEQRVNLRHSELLDCWVSVRTNPDASFGWVEMVWMHPEVHRILGFVCYSEWQGKRFAFNLGQVFQIEGDTILVRSRPVEAKPEQIAVLETLIGHELWDDAGNRIGKIIDCQFSLQTGVIDYYLFRAEGWRGVTGTLYQLPPEKILGFSRQRVRVAKVPIDHWIIDQEGVEQKVTKTAQQIQSSLSTKTHQITQQAREHLQDFTEKARQVQVAAAQHAKTASQVWSDEFPESQNLLQEGRTWLGRVQRRLSHLGEEVQEEISPLTAQLKEKLQSSRPVDRFTTRPTADPPSIEVDSRTVPPEDLADDEPWI
jgi:hypothetical protein